MKNRKLSKKEITFINRLDKLKQIQTDEVKQMLNLYNELYQTRVECLTCGKMLKDCINKLVEYKNSNKNGHSL